MSRQLITFQVDEQYFAIDIMVIREIRAWSPTTRLPHVPSHVAGVVNLRGAVLPVIDLAARLGWRQTDPTARHVIIVTRVGEQFRGLIVDSVSDIITIDTAQLQPPPLSSGGQIDPFLEGLVAVNTGRANAEGDQPERMVMVLNLPALIADDQLPVAA